MAPPWPTNELLPLIGVCLPVTESEPESAELLGPGLSRPRLSTIRYNPFMAAPSSLLREARKRAGLSQSDLAHRAGVTQSVISAYESGARQPSVPTLERLIAATGFDLGLQLEEPKPVPSQPTRALLHRSRKQIEAIAANHGISNVRVFGSVARGDEGPESDVDLLIDVAPGVGLLGIARCQAALERLLGCAVDLVPASDLKRGVADHVLAEAQIL